MGPWGAGDAPAAVPGHASSPVACAGVFPRPDARASPAHPGVERRDPERE